VDLVISDVQMPEMNGIEVLQAVRERAPRLPVLMLSGAWPGLLKDAQLLGADAVLEKPVALHELLATVRSLLQDAAGTGGERS
jgi:DNA-binding response OmpR family regulator